jgi:hypothetical protein
MEQPQSTAQNLYEFINIAYTSNTASSVTNMTSGINSYNRYTFGVNINSKKALNEWRLQNTLNYVHEVDSQCSSLYERLGYLPVMKMCTHQPFPERKTCQKMKNTTQ